MTRNHNRQRRATSPLFMPTMLLLAAVGVASQVTNGESPNGGASAADSAVAGAPRADAECRLDLRQQRRLIARRVAEGGWLVGAGLDVNPLLKTDNRTDVVVFGRSEGGPGSGGAGEIVNPVALSCGSTVMQYAGLAFRSPATVSYMEADQAQLQVWGSHNTTAPALALGVMVKPVALQAPQGPPSGYAEGFAGNDGRGYGIEP